VSYDALNVQFFGKTAHQLRRLVDDSNGVALAGKLAGNPRTHEAGAANDDLHTDIPELASGAEAGFTESAGAAWRLRFAAGGIVGTPA